jgi:hypothetical protein
MFNKVFEVSIKNGNSTMAARARIAVATGEA